MTWSRAQANFRGSKGAPVFFTPKDREQRMGEFAYFWKESDHGKFPKGTYLGMRCEFIFDRPNSHFGTGRNADKLKPQFAATYPGHGKLGGDLDNLVKLVKDGLNSVAYADDSQVAEIYAIKRYVKPGELSETRIAIMELSVPERMDFPKTDDVAQLSLSEGYNAESNTDPQPPEAT